MNPESGISADQVYANIPEGRTDILRRFYLTSLYFPQVELDIKQHVLVVI